MPKKRPDGLSLEPYANTEKWSRKRWAWEFLKRNERFRSSCKALAADWTKAAEEALAEEYGLVRFKDAKEAFRKDGTKPPFFRTVALTTTFRGQADGPKKLKRSLQVGDLAVIFRLDLIRKHKTGFQPQRDVLESVVRRHYKALTGRELADDDGAARTLRNIQKWALYLRLLDASRSMTQAKIAEMLYPNYFEDFPGTPRPEEWTSLVKKDLEKARLLAGGGYLSVAAMSKKTTGVVQTMPLSDRSWKDAKSRK